MFSSRALSLIVLLSFAASVSAGCSTQPAGNEEASESSSETTESETSGGKPGMADILVDRCDPRMEDACSEFIEPHMCCSDDPAALDVSDLGSPALPQYVGRGGEGMPLFSGDNNLVGSQGVCVGEDSVPASSALVEDNAQGCPVPCNPQWDASDIEGICGANTLCCQLQELGPTDCVFDAERGDAGCFRPVTGNDIMGLGGTDTTDWALVRHETHQDPGGAGCEQFAQSLPAQLLEENGLSVAEVALACFRQLSVADQRGLCLGAGGGISCPYAQPSYIDACRAINDEMGLSGCS